MRFGLRPPEPRLQGPITSLQHLFSRHLRLNPQPGKISCIHLVGWYEILPGTGLLPRFLLCVDVNVSRRFDALHHCPKRLRVPSRKLLDVVGKQSLVSLRNRYIRRNKLVAGPHVAFRARRHCRIIRAWHTDRIEEGQPLLLGNRNIVNVSAVDLGT